MCFWKKKAVKTPLTIAEPDAPAANAGVAEKFYEKSPDKLKGVKPERRNKVEQFREDIHDKPLDGGVG